MMEGLTVREMLEDECLSGAAVLAGSQGLDRLVTRLNVMEVPDILPWVGPNDFLLTTAYPLQSTDDLPHLVTELDSRRLSGLAIKLGRYLDALPAALLRQADELAFPIVQLPPAIAFADILNPVLTRIVSRQASALARSWQIHEALVQLVLSGGGLDDVAAAISGLLGNPVAITSEEDVIVADARLGGVTHMLSAAEVGSGNSLRLPDTRGDVASWGDDGLRYMTADISAGGRHYGRVIAFEQERPLVGVRQALEITATVAALLMTKERAVAAADSKSRADFLFGLFTGRMDRLDDVVAGGATFGWDLDQPLSVVLIECVGRLGTASSSAAALGAIADVVREPGAAVALLSGCIVVVVGAHDPRQTEHDLVDRLVSRLGAAAESVHVGISQPVPHALLLKDAYEQAQLCLRLGRQVPGLGQTIYYNELGIFRLLDLIQEDAAHSFVNEMLGPLAGDQADMRDLCKTLEALVDCNFNVAEASRVLHFHYNTLRYRLHRIQTLLGDFMSHPHRRLGVVLAIYLKKTRSPAA